MTRLQNIQTRILKIIHKNCFVKITLLNIRQVFTFQALMYHYEDLKEIYKKSNSETRNKSIQLPKTIKVISNKNSYLVLKTYNSLPKELKSLYSNKNNRKYILKIKLKIKNNFE